MAKRKNVGALSATAEARLQDAIARDPDNPELDDATLAALRPASEVLPSDLYAALTRPRGRPKAEVTKVAVKLRLDPNVVEAFRATGVGWQTRMNETLAREARRLKRRVGAPTEDQATTRL